MYPKIFANVLGVYFSGHIIYYIAVAIVASKQAEKINIAIRQRIENSSEPEISESPSNYDI
jgi:hypothetical protein